MKKFCFLLCILGLTLISHSEAKALDSSQARKLVDAIMNEIESRQDEYPILKYVSTGVNIHASGNATAVFEGFDAKYNISQKTQSPNDDGMLPAAPVVDVVNPGGIRFYIYVADHTPKVKSTKYYNLTDSPDGPALLYCLETNPEDKALQDVVRTCVEMKLKKWLQ
jgi:hypothetical protein